MHVLAFPHTNTHVHHYQQTDCHVHLHHPEGNSSGMECLSANFSNVFYWYHLQSHKACPFSANFCQIRYEVKFMLQSCC